MNITSITIIHSQFGSDVLLLHTDLPEGVFPFKGTAVLKLDIAAGHGEEYCKKHFPDIEIKVINDE